jgi:DNA-binding MarR family transcriptional regulator
MKRKNRLAPEETIGFLLWDTTRAFTSRFSERIARYGVTFGLWPFLRELWEEDGLTQRELSERVRMRGPTTVAAINRLEKAGMVRRVANAKDGRKINVFLTDKGRAAYDLAMPDVEAINRQGLRHLSAAEQQTLKDLLRRLRGNMNEE